MIQSPFIYLGRNVMSTDSTFYSLVLLTNVVTLFLRHYLVCLAHAEKVTSCHHCVHVNFLNKEL